jgi:hypothetical protein
VLRKLLRHGRGIQYAEHTEGDGREIFQTICKLGLRGHRFKEAQCPLSLRSVENLDKSQKPKSAALWCRLLLAVVWSQ